MRLCKKNGLPHTPKKGAHLEKKKEKKVVGFQCLWHAVRENGAEDPGPIRLQQVKQNWGSGLVTSNVAQFCVGIASSHPPPPCLHSFVWKLRRAPLPALSEGLLNKFCVGDGPQSFCTICSQKGAEGLETQNPGTG